MYITITEYLFIFIIFSCIGTASYYVFQHLFRQKEIEAEEIRKEAEELKKKELEEPFGIDDLSGLPGKISSGFNDLSKIGGKMKDGFDEVGKIFQKVTDGFNEIGNKFKNIGDGLKYSFEGIGDTFEGLGDGLTTGFNDIGKLFKYTGLFTFSYLECGAKFITNIFTYCVIFYIFDIVKQIFYAPFRFAFWMLWLMGISSIYRLVDSVWALIYVIDDTMNSAIGMSAFSYTKTVRDDCYYCRRMKKSTLKRIAGEVDDDFNVKFPEDLARGQDKFDKAADSFADLVGESRPQKKPKRVQQTNSKMASDMITYSSGSYKSKAAASLLLAAYDYSQEE